MKYVIFSLNDLEGFVRDYTQDLHNTFYVSHETDEFGIDVEWCKLPHNAKQFDSEEEAWQEAYSIWGEGWFAKMALSVMAIHEDALERLHD